MLSLNNLLIAIWFWFLGHNNPWVCRVWGIPRQHFWSSYPGGRGWLPSCSRGCWIPARWWGPIRDQSTSQSWCYPLAFSGFWTSGVTRQWRCTFDLWTKTQCRASAEAVCSPKSARKTARARSWGAATTGTISATVTKNSFCFFVFIIFASSGVFILLIYVLNLTLLISGFH